MKEDTFQVELDRYYGYRNQSFVRYTHRIRIEHLRDLFRRLPVPPRHGPRPRALDAGSGFGVYSILMAEAGYAVMGVDINGEEIRLAKEWAAARGVQDRIDFRVGDLETMPGLAEAFDLIVCSEVLEHLKRPEAGAHNLHRMLKPGGRAIVSMPNMACLMGGLQWSYRKSGLRALLGRPPLDLHQEQHSRYWFGNILRLLRMAGFQVEKVSSTTHIPLWWSLDSVLTRRFGLDSLCSRLDSIAGRLPGLNYFGFNLIVLLRKP